MSSVLEDLASKVAEDAGEAAGKSFEDGGQEMLENQTAKEGFERMASEGVSPEFVQGLSSDLVSDGATDTKSLVEKSEQAASQTRNTAKINAVKSANEAKGIDGGIETAVQDLPEEASSKLGDLKQTTSDPEKYKTLQDDIEKPPSKAKKLWEGIKKSVNAKSIFAGLTITSVITWLATGHGLQDLFNLAGNVAKDVAHDFFGALQGIGESIGKPLGEGLGSAAKNAGIAIGVVVAVVILVVGIVYAVKKYKKK